MSVAVMVRIASALAVHKLLLQQAGPSHTSWRRVVCGILGTGGLIIKFRACTPARARAFHVIPTRVECAFLVRGIAGYNQGIFKLERYQRMKFGKDPMF